MMLTMPVCATVARLHISKIDSWAQHGLNAEADLLHVGADIILPNGDEAVARAFVAHSVTKPAGRWTRTS